MESDVHIFTDSFGQNILQVKLIDQNLWLSLSQLADLYMRDRSVIAKHIKNIFKEEELDKKAVVANYAITAKDSKIYQVEHYNLDMIISVGYRINSKQGTKFRKWATSILTNHLLKGYTLNQQALAFKSLTEIESSLNLIKINLLNQNNVDLTTGIMNIIRQYARSWSLLLKYDENRLDSPISSNYYEIYTYEYAKSSISNLLKELIIKGEASSYFGKEKDQALERILQNLNQTFDSQPLYRSTFEKAANLLYLVIKDHPFIDGNKRIGSFLFMLYLKDTNISLNSINDNTLVALALLVAESNPKQKDLIIKLIMNLLM